MNGKLIVIAGPMFAGKTDRLVWQLDREAYAGRSVDVFKYFLDGRRYDENSLVAHNGRTFRCSLVRSSWQIQQRALDINPDVVAVDEAMFFDEGLPSALNALADRGIVVWAAGLDLDYRNRPFGPMPELMAYADDVVSISAICTNCGGEATRTQRVVDVDDQVLVGAGESHVARCRACHDPEPTNLSEEVNHHGQKQAGSLD